MADTAAHLVDCVFPRVAVVTFSKKAPSRLRGRGQMEQSLYGDTRNRLAPVGVTGLRHGTSLKNVARTGIQTGDVFFLDEDFGEKPKDRNVGISPLQLASA